MKIKENLFLKLFICIITMLSFVSCASFSYQFQNPTFLTPYFLTFKNVKELNGEYSIVAKTKDSTYNRTYKSFNNFYEIINENRKKEKIEEEKIDDYSFKINIIDSLNIEIKYLNNGIIFNELNVEYELKGGYLFFKNKKTIISGVPYLFGGIEINKIRLTRDLNMNLVAEIAHHHSGLILFIFGDSKSFHYQCYYHKIR
ncbi:hypothetical protein [Tenacibaculum ovolyticum]|uniref:hypothetical protein n=2 Tax=Tenacibaculum ovolyticum TaxID=104270 RepID=UPI003BAC4E18